MHIDLLVCGNPSCSKPFPPKCCQACRGRSYCNVYCQKANWPVHKSFCAPTRILSDHDKTIYAYDAKHRILLLTLAYNLYNFDHLFAHLQGFDRLRFLAVARTSFLHIKLRPVANPSRRQETRVSFQDAQIVDATALTERQACDVSKHVERRFPAICLGFSIVAADGSYQGVSTITHPFKWPSMDSGRPLDLRKTINLILLLERMWSLEAQVKQDAQEKNREAQIWKNTHEACWMVEEGFRTAGEEVERSWSRAVA
ncbi:hypothetical protein CVT26_010641 [Gymnopilus dilepis]|uniref:MYND-type domain-containing protein n=1 Tax=Gymnopilus dilepis TaxID=231916 RepID=A0A409Y0T7_9AGAR|nr:hypothetical protein CVT26_010641 [Gymnopilus dilepis]